jgi:hypothetical protein
MNCGDEMSLDLGFPYIALSPRLLTSFNEFFVGVDREEHKLRGATRPYEVVDRFNTTHSRHGDIHYDYVWIEAQYL